ncbi:hypothetical protein A3709_05275 [Halioglobus sp. HI00S01]|uniref:hypothetical protein n=1 Tax=Halioglobus sp. HI00S01 TaxID=1822214 RepID=UPI0007C362AF|nr:hypothetical protein [Halioglobus sp. HI00S01]KZX56514.1 hypothetical protein A3709_05275 [Halioglobus sp. HI00S01]
MRLTQLIATSLLLTMFTSDYTVADDTTIEQTDDVDALVGWDAAEPDEGSDSLDERRANLDNRAQELAYWLDGFFGDPQYDLDKPESVVRLIAITDWDEEDGAEFKFRVRGKVQLPNVSKKLNLVFRGEESDDDEELERYDDSVALEYKLNEGTRSKFDATIGYSSRGVRPGVRYRNEGPFTRNSSYRWVQQLQYTNKDGFYTTTRIDFNRSFGENYGIRWDNRGIYGEETEGIEWRSKLSLRQRLGVDTDRPTALSYFAAVNGVTQVEDFTKNYRLGVRFRRQFYKDYLFLELEPAYNWRRKEYEDNRDTVFSINIKLEMALGKDLTD